MAYYDLPLEDLRGYKPALEAPADLDEFWALTLAQQPALDVMFSPVDSELAVIETFDVTFLGFGGAAIKGWLQLPKGIERPLPAIVEYVGYGGGRGLAHERTFYATAGFAHFVMDTRGQGAGWSVGHTPDPHSAGNPSQPGFLTQGIDDPTTYYYRRVYVDAVRAVEAARSHPSIDPDRVGVTGISQGGGLAIAVAALEPGIGAMAADVPFLSDFPRATRIIDSNPYAEVRRYLKAHRDRVDQTYRTLSYFDVAILARRATAPALFAVALMDEICPPSTVYAAYNHYGGPHSMVEYEFNDHEGGEGFHQIEKVRWLRSRLA
jgi:cephalosporin-C deacetylase